MVSQTEEGSEESSGGGRSGASLAQDIINSASSITPLGDTCVSVPTCDFENRYRTYDGTCNNPINPVVGKRGTRFVRILLSEYDDGKLHFYPAMIESLQLTTCINTF